MKPLYLLLSLLLIYSCNKPEEAKQSSIESVKSDKIPELTFEPWIPDTVLHDGNPWINKP